MRCEAIFSDRILALDKAKAADEELASAETTVACFRGYADCVDGAKEMGVIYGMGAYETGEIKTKKAMLEAYEMGKGV